MAAGKDDDHTGTSLHRLCQGLKNLSLLCLLIPKNEVSNATAPGRYSAAKMPLCKRNPLAGSCTVTAAIRKYHRPWTLPNGMTYHAYQTATTLGMTKPSLATIAEDLCTLSITW